jgi:hypothetical protein
MRRHLPVGVFLPLLLLCVGCGPKGGSAFAPVSGRVLLNNKPLANANVRFQPERKQGDDTNRPDSYGETDEQGYFTLKPVGKDWSGTEGALVGKHFVQISTFDRTLGQNGLPRGELVPYQYNRDSSLTFTVPPEGTTEANFLELKALQ